MLAMEVLVRGATEFNEPGVFMSFEATDKELVANVASMGFDLPGLCARKKLSMDYVRVERSEIEEPGEYHLEGLFVRLQCAIEAVGAKRVVRDTLEALFSGFGNDNILRAELGRLFRRLKYKGVTAVITVETGKGTLTRNGIDEYVADCVIFLDHRVEDQTSIRRLRVVKYRGTLHGTSKYPFLIGAKGFSVFHLSSLKLDHKASAQRISTGVPRLMRCWTAKASIAAPASLSPAASARARVVWPPVLCRPPASEASARSIWRRSNRRMK